MCASYCTFWLVAWLGTSAAGGFLGLGLGSIPGLVMGAMCAAIVGAPIHVTAATVTWIFWLNRFRLVMAGLARASTGVVSILLVLHDDFLLFGTSLAGLAVCAGFLGAAGATLAGALYLGKLSSELKIGQVGNRPVWRCSLHSLFVRITVLATLMAIGVGITLAIQKARQNVQRAECETRLRLITVMIQGYHSVHGQLPPPYPTAPVGHHKPGNR